MFSIASNIAWLADKPPPLRATVRYHLALILGEPVGPMGPGIEAWYGSAEFGKWRSEMSPEASESEASLLETSRRLANAIDHQWSTSSEELRKSIEDPGLPVSSQAQTPRGTGPASPLAEVLRWLLRTKVPSDSVSIVFAALILEEENSQEIVTTSQIRRLLESEGVVISNPPSLIQSLAQKDQPDLIIHGKSGPRQELLIGVTPATSKKIRENLSQRPPALTVP